MGIQTVHEHFKEARFFVICIELIISNIENKYYRLKINTLISLFANTNKPPRANVNNSFGQESN